MKQGIVLIALGHPYYGRMAYNLALTLKFKNPSMQIAIIHNHTSLSHLDEKRMSIFDQLIPIEDSKYWTVNGAQNYAYPKLFLDQLTPFEETIFLDVDTAWCGNNDVFTLFAQCSKFDFVIKNRNAFDFKTKTTNDGDPLWFWVNENDVAKEYGIKSGKMYSVHAEFIYFKKNERSSAIFKTAIEIASDVKVESGLKWAGQNNCDEVPISISMVLNKVTIPVGYNPIHWYQYDDQFLSRTELMNNFSLISSGGNVYPTLLKSFYNDLVQYAAQTLNMPDAYKHQDKKNFLVERQSI